MNIKVTTTITTLIDVDTLEPDHRVSIEAEAGVSESIARAVAIGAAKSLIESLESEPAKAPKPSPYGPVE